MEKVWTAENCSNTEYIARIKSLLLDDLTMAHPNVKIRETDAVWDALTKLHEYCDGEKFIFVLDEWDYIYHQDFVTDKDKTSFTKFLSNLLKDKAYVEMAYMTGILPISKYSSGSELNMFFEYSMLHGKNTVNISALPRKEWMCLLNYKDGYVSIPNKELIEYAHHTHSPLQTYSNEAELASIIRWV